MLDQTRVCEFEVADLKVFCGLPHYVTQARQLQRLAGVWIFLFKAEIVHGTAHPNGADRGTKLSDRQRAFLPQYHFTQPEVDGEWLKLKAILSV